MKVAIISDIHGNLEALSALIEPYDELWVLGDLVDYGPDPGAVVDFVRSHAAVVVRGNHDDAVGWNRDPRCSAPYREMAKETMDFTLSVLSAGQRSYLANLPLIARSLDQRPILAPPVERVRQVFGDIGLSKGTTADGRRKQPILAQVFAGNGGIGFIVHLGVEAGQPFGLIGHAQARLRGGQIGSIPQGCFDQPVQVG